MSRKSKVNTEDNLAFLFGMLQATSQYIIQGRLSVTGLSCHIVCGSCDTNEKYRVLFLAALISASS